MIVETMSVRAASGSKDYAPTERQPYSCVARQSSLAMNAFSERSATLSNSERFCCCALLCAALILSAPSHRASSHVCASGAPLHNVLPYFLLSFASHLRYIEHVPSLLR